MPCYHPRSAIRLAGQTKLTFTKRADPSSPTIGPLPFERFQIGCGTCLGCLAQARAAWTFRCHLELQFHPYATFTTLTFADDALTHNTVDKRDTQLFLKRLRKTLGATRPIRFYGCGEYGTQRKRAHYHFILYNTHTSDKPLIERAWPYGHVRVEEANPRNIAYTAGYVTKKYSADTPPDHDKIDLDTGEVWRWYAPFFVMSRRPGIGAQARQWTTQWRDTIFNHNPDGEPTPQHVPRYLHDAWKKRASPEDVEQLLAEKRARRQETNTQQLRNMELHHEQRHKQQTEKRNRL